ncbi:hypothetical protein EBCG_04209 [Escherichia marmotae]|nr:hypothetical protein EBCG_04209 [Escherichia marmotae]
MEQVFFFYSGSCWGGDFRGGEWLFQMAKLMYSGKLPI